MNKHFLRKSTVAMLSLATIFSCGKDDEPEEPLNTAPTIMVQSFSASEMASDTDILGKVVATDAENDALSFSLKTNSNSLFEITVAGDISLATGMALDFETAIEHKLSVEVSDGKLTSNAEVTINVVDVDENQAPVFLDQSFSIAENSAFGSLVGNLVYSDSDGDILTTSWGPGSQVSTFSLEDDKLLIIDINNQGVLNFEVKDNYILSIVVSDGQLSTTAVITVNVTDANDAPGFDGETAITAAEDVADTAVLATLPAVDEDGDTLSYSITNDGDDLFSIDNDGNLRLQSGKSLDYETKTSHVFDVVATDPDGAAGSTEVTLTVTDVAEPQTITVSTLAGGPSVTDFNYPLGIVIGPDGNVYVADANNASIKRVTPQGAVSTFAGGAGTLMEYPQDLVFDSNGNLFVTDSRVDKVFKVDTQGVITTFIDENAYPGSNPNGIAIDAANNVYFTDNSTDRIYKATPSGIVSTFAGSNRRGSDDGTLADATFNRPKDIVLDDNGTMYVLDNGNYLIRKISSSGIVSTVAGSTNGFADGTGSNAQFSFSPHITLDHQGNLYVTDNANRRVRKINSAGEVTTLFGDGTSTSVDGDASIATISSPQGIAVSQDGKTIYVSQIFPNQIRKVSITE